MGRDRFGMTWVEWLVVVTLGGIALSLLLLPVFNTSHRPGRTNRCEIQLKNLALAAIMHENSQGRFPGWAMDFGTYNPSETPGNRSAPDADRSRLRRHRKIGTWAVALLPYLEAQPAYEYWTMDRYPIVGGGHADAHVSTGASGEGFSGDAAPNLAIMQCPSSPTLRGDMGRNSYIANTGLFFPADTRLESTRTVVTPAGEQRDVDFAESMSSEFGVVTNQFPGVGSHGKPMPVGSSVTLEDFKDGHAHTALFSENLQAIPWHRAGFVDAEDLFAEDATKEIAYPAHSRFTQGWVWHATGDERPVHRINGAFPEGDIYLISMTPANAGDLARPSSAHAEGVNVGFADGSTRFISETVDVKVLQAMLTPAGEDGDLIPPGT